MDQRLLGRTGSMISAIGLGCVTFGREIDEETSYMLMDYAVEKGITFFDTAEAYGGGQARLGRNKSFGISDVRETTGEMSSSERIIGTWMRKRGCRDEITICTKLNTGGSAENIPKALSRSLERLGTERVDIYKMHSPDLNTPIAETLSAMDAELKSGRIGCVGGSNYSAAQFREALDVSEARGYARFEITQPPYNLAQPEAERDLFPLCEQESISVTPYSPLGAGFLTGKYKQGESDIPKGTRFDIAPAHTDIYFNKRSFQAVGRLHAKSEEFGIPVVRLAMAWAMTHPAITSILVGARTLAHIDNAIQAYEMGMDAGMRADLASIE